MYRPRQTPATVTSVAPYTMFRRASKTFTVTPNVQNNDGQDAVTTIKLTYG